MEALGSGTLYNYQTKLTNIKMIQYHSINKKDILNFSYTYDLKIYAPSIYVPISSITKMIKNLIIGIIYIKFIERMLITLLDN